MLYLAVCDENNRIYRVDSSGAVGRTGNTFAQLNEEDFIPLPHGADVMRLPGRSPVGLDFSTNDFNLVEKCESIQTGSILDAACAVLPQGYLRTFLPAYAKRADSQELPLFGYTALAFKDDELVVAAVRTDERDTWMPESFNTPDLPHLVSSMLDKYPDNRIVSHLGRCAREYRCFTAQNFFYSRNEGGLPTSPVCNANCLGCISLQPAQCCKSPQERIKFVPRREEIVEVMLEHLENASDPIISFGQGCEGEPSLSCAAIIPAIEEVRKITKRGTINMNTNAGNTKAITDLCESGMNSFRVSMISAGNEEYLKYHAPQGYSLIDVKKSILEMKKRGTFVSLNYLVFPGFNDTQIEITEMAEFIYDTKVDMIQLRNLNIDPDRFVHVMLKGLNEPPCGMYEMFQYFKEAFPGLIIGNFSINLD